jgi:SAM-dependent methyltransferase
VSYDTFQRDLAHNDLTGAMGTMAAIRGRYLAPSLLAPFAEDMANRLSRISIGPLLEIHADIGTLTQAIASSMSAGLTIVATDPGSEMIAFAAARPGMARVSWRTADPAALPFPDATFGIVTCHFAVVTIPDRVKAYVEARRVMKPGGRFVFTVPARIRNNPVAERLQDALEELFPADPPRFLEHILHGYGDSQAIDDDLTESGFTDAFYTSVDLPFAAASARDVAVSYCLGTPLRHEIEGRAAGAVEQVIADVTVALERHFGKGQIEATMRAHFISAAG